MSDAAFGFLLLGIALLVVLGIAFVISSRGGRQRGAATTSPPPGVHMPGPSFLPVIFSVGAVLLGMGFAVKGDAAVANPFLAIPGVLVIITAVVGWVRAANREWVEVEHGSHDSDEPVH